MDTEPTGDERGHDPDFYIEDGNIVLSAKDSENYTTYFRLHRSILMKHSPVFADMFNMPPPSTTDQYDGVPLAEMSDDADVLRDFIALLYEPQCISVILGSDDFALKMLGPTELAKKYQVDWICKMVASHLEKQWPKTLEGWDRIARDEGESWTRDQVGGEFWQPSWDDDTLKLRQLPEPVSSIRLASECEATSILPVAFLHMLRLPLDPPGSLSVWAAPERGLLTQHDRYRLSLGRERIGKWFADQNRGTWVNCGSELRCEAVTYRSWNMIATEVGRDGDVLKIEPRVPGYFGDICPVCKKKLEREVDSLRYDFFCELSTFFQLDEDA
ncbi:hypothetical protein C8R44DRAFT_604575 [Mycena epipterygia]|nr:hypothetical protein C8R44DRAFT_604575 [Mycena epipterygia]